MCHCVLCSFFYQVEVFIIVSSFILCTAFLDLLLRWFWVATGFLHSYLQQQGVRGDTQLKYFQVPIIQTLNSLGSRLSPVCQLHTYIHHLGSRLHPILSQHVADPGSCCNIYKYLCIVYIYIHICKYLMDHFIINKLRTKFVSLFLNSFCQIITVIGG